MANEDAIHEFLGDDDYLVASFEVGPGVRVCFEDVSRAVKLKHEALLDAEEGSESALARLGAERHDFLGFFARAAPQTFRSYEGLCEQMGMSDEFEANPLALILANKPRCCTHIARCFLDGALDVRRRAGSGASSSAQSKQAAAASPERNPRSSEAPEGRARLQKPRSPERAEEERCWKRTRQVAKAPNEFEN